MNPFLMGFPGEDRIWCWCEAFARQYLGVETDQPIVFDENEVWTAIEKDFDNGLASLRIAEKKQ